VAVHGCHVGGGLVSAGQWVLVLLGLMFVIGGLAWWIADPGGAPVDGCEAIHPVNGTSCDRGRGHDAIDVHRDWHGMVWFDDDPEPIRTCQDDTDWEGRPWAGR